MNHPDIELLLGAFALDATEPDEAMAIEAHLLECPRCRAEVESHRDLAAMLGNSATEAPPGLWDKIAAAIDQGPASRQPPPPPAMTATVRPLRARTKRSGWAATGLAAAAAAIIAVLAVEIGHLHAQVSSLRSAVSQLGLAGAAAQVEAGPHRTIVLTSATLGHSGTIVVARNGAAYWTWSSLPELPSTRTYQLWGLSRGRAVSLGLMGPDPHAYSGLRVEPEVTQVMVTAEPAGGTPAPTTPVVAQGPVPAGTFS